MTTIATLPRTLRSTLRSLLARGTQHYIQAGRPLLPVTRFARLPLRMFYHRSPVLRHDNKRYIKPFLLWKLHDLLVEQHPSDFRIYGNRLRFRSFGSLMSVQGYYVGEIEYHLVRFVISQIRPNFCMLDVGAHHGLYTLIVAYELKRRGWKGLIHSFEPDAGNFKLLEHNVRQNRLEQYVVLHNQAVDDHAGTSTLIMNPNENSDNVLDAVELSPNELPPGLVRREVSTTYLDHLLACVPHVNLVKIDIQGREARAISGARTIIEQHRPTLVVEAVPGWPGTPATRQILDALGYDVFGVDERGQLCSLDSDDVFVSWDWVGIPQ